MGKDKIIMVALYPSLMCADQLLLGVVIRQLAPWCVGFHIDVMDNHFVPNLEGSVSMINAVAGATDKKLWVHLMVDRPTTLIARMRLRADDIVSFHYECQEDGGEVAEMIRALGCRPSLAIRPSTDVADVCDVLTRIDHVLLMSVEPGFAGQTFLPETYERLAQLVEYRQRYNKRLVIGIDGGVGQVNYKDLAAAGVEDFAVGNAIFKQPDIQVALRSFVL